MHNTVTVRNSIDVRPHTLYASKHQKGVFLGWFDRVPEVVFTLHATPVIFCYRSVCLNEEVVARCRIMQCSVVFSGSNQYPPTQQCEFLLIMHMAPAMRYGSEARRLRTWRARARERAASYFGPGSYSQHTTPRR